MLTHIPQSGVFVLMYKGRHKGSMQSFFFLVQLLRMGFSLSMALVRLPYIINKMVLLGNFPHTTTTGAGGELDSGTT